mmetsp:Transcript_26242/g.48937  ORF Transcript_26242/g.48937 Transcript_26242/m.48937 type:complete len:190 (-) Transcript_26242:777-1346(-)
MNVNMEDLDAMIDYNPTVADCLIRYNLAESTAHGSLGGVRALCGWDLAGKSILIQGLGNVGMALLKLCSASGMNLIVSEVNQEKIAEAKRLAKNIRVVSPEDVITTQCDVFVPAVSGPVVTRANVGSLACGALASVTNNVLETSGLHEDLKARGITYIPDFIINSGGAHRVEAIVFDGRTSDIEIEQKV